MARPKKGGRTTPPKRRIPRLVVTDPKLRMRAQVREALARSDRQRELEDLDAAVDRWGAGGRSEVLADLDRAVEAAAIPQVVSGEELRTAIIGAAAAEEDRRARLRREREAVEELVRRGGGPGGAGLRA